MLASKDFLSTKESYLVWSLIWWLLDHESNANTELAYHMIFKLTLIHAPLYFSDLSDSSRINIGLAWAKDLEVSDLKEHAMLAQ